MVNVEGAKDRQVCYLMVCVQDATEYCMGRNPKLKG